MAEPKSSDLYVRMLAKIQDLRDRQDELRRQIETYETYINELWTIIEGQETPDVR